MTTKQKRELMEEYEKTLNDYREIWVPLIYGNIADGYQISNHGRFKCKRFPDRIKKTLWKHGREIIQLSLNDYTRSDFSVSRLVAYTFVPIDEEFAKSGYTAENLSVLHNNGIHSCNADFNLRWGLKTESMSNGIYRSKLTPDLVHEICKCIINGMSNAKIREYLNVSISDPEFTNIINGTNWKLITSQYNLSLRHEAYDNDFIHKLCVEIQSGKPLLDISYEYNVSINFLYLLKKGECHTDITSQYKFKFSNRRPRRKISDSKLHEICHDISEGILSIHEIAKKHNVGYTTVYGLKMKTNYIHISSLYDFSKCNHKRCTLTPEIVHNICAGLEEGIDILTLSKIFKTSNSTIKNILYHKSYTNISKLYNF